MEAVKKENTYIAVDLGGTKILVGEVDASGVVIASKSYPSSIVNQQTAVEALCSALDDYMKNLKTTPSAIGVGIVGRVNNAEGIWYEIDPHRSCPTPLAEIISKKYNLPCAIDNDVKSATRAEKRWGAGKVTNDFVYINLGTGIAAGVVSAGMLLRGNCCNAGEVGHTRVGPGTDSRCVCGRTDCVELLASGSGIDRTLRLLQSTCSTDLVLPSEKRVDVREVFALAKKGDELCLKVVDMAAQAAADLIMNLVRVSDPYMVVLGGGLISDEFYLDKIRENLGAETMRFVGGGVVGTSLEPAYAGLLGAASVAMDLKA